MRRGYGENPWTPFFRVEPTVRIAYWTRGGEPVKLTIKDENGMLWKELDGTSRRGMNVVEYDLSADAKLADAAEAKAREKALAKEKEKEKEKAKDGDKGKDADQGRDGVKEKEAGSAGGESKPEKTASAKKETPPDEDEDDDADAVKPEEERPSPAAGPSKPLDPELYDMLADPLSATRKRYLPPGKYTVEIRSGQSMEKTTLNVQAEKETGFGED